jgi:DNA-binding Xre family transcriptional regulator
MKNKKAKSKVQAILMKRNMKIVDLFNKIKEENAKPVAKYMISQIVNGKRTNYEIITLNKICKALNVSANEIIEENPTRYSSTKSIKSNTSKAKVKPKVKRSGRVVVPNTVDVDINMHSGNGYIDDIIDEKGLEDIKRTLNLKDVEEESFADEQEHITRKNDDYSPEEVLFDDREGIPTMRDETEEERETRIYNESFNVDPKDRIDDEQNWKDEIINDKDNKWGNGSIKQDEEPIVEQDEDEIEEWRWEKKDEWLGNDEEDDFGF